MRLLIAEDEEDLAEALGVFFEKNHFSVDVVHDGRAACEYAESNAYDAIILDVMMPYMDGFAALRRMREPGARRATASKVLTPVRTIICRSLLTRMSCSSGCARCSGGARPTGQAC